MDGTVKEQLSISRVSDVCDVGESLGNARESSAALCLPRKKLSRPRAPSEAQDITGGELSSSVSSSSAPPSKRRGFLLSDRAAEDERDREVMCPSSPDRPKWRPEASPSIPLPVHAASASPPELIDECEDAIRKNFHSSRWSPACGPEAFPQPPPTMGVEGPAQSESVDAASRDWQDYESDRRARRHSTGCMVDLDDEYEGVDSPCFFGVPSPSLRAMGQDVSRSFEDLLAIRQVVRRQAASEGGGSGASDGDGCVDSPALREIWRGDIGLALFSPLDEAAFEPLLDPLSAAAVDGTAETDGDGDSSLNKEEEEEDLGPIFVVPEELSSLKSSPRILTESMMLQIRDRGLHPTVQLMPWTRAYSLSRDGDSFHTMLRLCEGYSHTVFAARTLRGDVLGGYADNAWTKPKGGGMRKSFFGSGRAFVFATDPADDDSASGGSAEAEKKDEGGEDVIRIYRWTGENTYSQVFCADDEHLAMGGGGSFGIIVEENFSRGSTGRCATFGNPPLTRDCGGCFEICDFEVYGLRSMLSGSLSLMF